MSEKSDRVQLEPTWKKALASEFESGYMQELRNFLILEKKAGKTIYPSGAEYFNAFNTTPLNNVRVVILGQDPYHGPGQAHGLCFSVCSGIRTPPSLINIYKEIYDDLGIVQPGHGFLQFWAEQGVLLLNSTLTVEKGKAGSHQKKGWETFTDKAVRLLSDTKENIVFLLWGSYAQKKGAVINREKHLVLQSVHPSPLSAHRGFFGCGHFSKSNHYLKSKGLTEINWQLPEL